VDSALIPGFAVLDEATQAEPARMGKEKLLSTAIAVGFLSGMTQAPTGGQGD
jgi:hypothetical protein